MKQKIMIMSMLAFTVLYGTTACTSSDSIYGQNYSQTGSVIVNTAPENTAAENTAAENTAAENTTSENIASENIASENITSENIASQNTASQYAASSQQEGSEVISSESSTYGDALSSTDGDSSQNMEGDVRNASEFEGEFQFGGQDGTDVYSLTPGNDIWTGTYDKEEDEWTEESQEEPAETINITYPDEEHIYLRLKMQVYPVLLRSKETRRCTEETITL